MTVIPPLEQLVERARAALQNPSRQEWDEITKILVQMESTASKPSTVSKQTLAQHQTLQTRLESLEQQVRDSIAKAQTIHRVARLL